MATESQIERAARDDREVSSAGRLAGGSLIACVPPMDRLEKLTAAMVLLRRGQDDLLDAVGVADVEESARAAIARADSRGEAS